MAVHRTQTWKAAWVGEEGVGLVTTAQHDNHADALAALSLILSKTYEFIIIVDESGSMRVRTQSGAIDMGLIEICTEQDTFEDPSGPDGLVSPTDCACMSGGECGD